MSKSSKKIQKNMKKVNEKKKEEYPVKNQIMSLAKYLLIIVIFVILICMVSSIVQKDYTLDDGEEEISNEILAGEIFNRGESTYYVVFYDFSDDGSIEDYLSVKSSKIYKVDLSNNMNSQIVGEESNKDASNLDELSVSDITLIKIVDGKIEDYIEESTNVIEYLNEVE